VWIQDTSGIDVGDAAEKAELLGLGQALIYSIQQTDVPMMCLVLRKASAAAHYLLGRPPANRQNAFTLGGGHMSILAFLTDPTVVSATLLHLEPGPPRNVRCVG
jgi:glutaconyl-CoA decarboxylase